VGDTFAIYVVLMMNKGTRLLLRLVKSNFHERFEHNERNERFERSGQVIFAGC
jgi:hypothetical protein